MSKNVEGFITSKRIDEQKVNAFDTAIEKAMERRKSWALSERLGPVDALIIYGAYRTIDDALIGIKKKLGEGIIKKENPVSAELVQPLFEPLINIAEELDRVELLLQNNKKLASTSIDAVDKLRHILYEKAVSAGISPMLVSTIEENQRRELLRLGGSLHGRIENLLQ